MGGAVNEEQVFPWQIGTTGLTVTYRILHWSGSGWDSEATGTMTERAGGLYEVKFTPDAIGFWLALAYYTVDYTRYDFGVAYFIGMGVAYDNYELLTDGVYGIEAIKDLITGLNNITAASVWAETGRELSTPANYKADLTTLETRLSALRAGYLDQLDFALQEAIAGRAPSGEYDTELDVILSSRAPASEYDTEMAHIDVDVSSRAPSGEYNTQMGTGERASATALATAQADLDNPNQYKADVSGLAPSGEYDTQMGTGERASAASLEDAMQKATTPAYNQDTDSLEALREVIDTKAPANEYDTQLDANMSTRATPAQVNSEVDTALAEIDLDHLIQVSAGAEEPTDGSYLDQIMHKDVSQTFDAVTDSLEALSEAIAAIEGASATAKGKLQVIEVSITNAANNGVTTVATVGSQPCIIEGVVIHADTIQTTDMTSCAVEGGVNQVIEFIGTGDAVQANLNAADKQVGWTGIVRFAVGKIITIDLQGTGATAVDLTITIKYRACVDGGVLA